MSYQDMFNILLGLCSFLGGWWLKNVWLSIKDLQKAEKSLLSKLSQIEVLIAGEYAKKDDVNKVGDTIMKRLDKLENLEVVLASHYVTKEEFHKSIESLFAKLDKIDEKLDKKADKH